MMIYGVLKNLRLNFISFLNRLSVKNPETVIYGIPRVFAASAPLNIFYEFPSMAVKKIFAELHQSVAESAHKFSNL